MRTLDEQLAYDLELEHKNYLRACDRIKKRAVRKHMLMNLQERVHTQMSGCTTSISDTTNSLFVYLSPEHNISKDWMIFLETNEAYLGAVGKGDEYKVKHDQNYGSYDYKWNDLSIIVNYGNGKCKRVKIGTKTKTTTEDQYEIQCL